MSGTRKRFWMVDNTENLESEFKKVVKYDPDKKYAKPEFVYFIDQNLVFDDVAPEKRYGGLITKPSVLLLDGKKKSKKSTFAAMLSAAHFNIKGRYQNIKCFTDYNQQLLWFDTEQNPPEFENMMGNIVRISGREKYPKNFHPFNIKFLAPEGRINFILNTVDRLIEWYERRGSDERDKIAIIVIDQIADLIYNVNDAEAVKDLIAFLDILILKTGAIIVTIIHKNKNDNSTNGLLGHELEKKSSTYVSAHKESGSPANDRYGSKTKIVTNDEEGDDNLPSRIYFNDTRVQAYFRSFLIQYNHNGYPVVVRK